MSNQSRNLEIGRKWFIDMWSYGSSEVANEIIDPEYDPEFVHIPKQGPEQVIHEMRYFRSVFPDLTYEIEHIIANEDEVWVYYKGTGKQKGNMWGFEPTNKVSKMTGLGILFINQKGLVYDRKASYCMYDTLEQLGIAPSFYELSEIFPQQK